MFQVCLAFHPYPQLIPPNFSTLAGSALQPVTAPSSCPWIDHLASGRHSSDVLIGRPIRTSLSLRLPIRLTLHGHEVADPLYKSKVRRHPREVGSHCFCRHAVSGSISLPSRGSFRLSLTVLVHYRSIDEYLALEDGPPYSDRISRVPPYLSRLVPHRVFSYGAITHYGRTFPDHSVNRRLKLTGCSHFARHYFGNLG